MNAAPTDDAGSSAGSNRLRVVTYNVHACIGTDRQFSPPRIADVLRELDADFIGLQELEDRPYEEATVSTWLGRELGMHATPGATLKRGDSHYGNLLLSRNPPRSVRLHDISVPGPEPRGIIDADLHAHGRHLRLLVTHFGLKAGERREQVDAIVDIVEARDADLTVLLGDFNEWRPASYLHKALRPVFGRLKGPRTWPSRQALLALDCIGASPYGAVVSRRVVRTTLARQASDHLPLVCDLEWPIPRRAT